MTDVIHKNIVLVLNRNWQAINVTTPAMAFCQMSTDVATALDIQGKEYMVPTKWDDWRNLPVREKDFAIGTPGGDVRAPTVIVLANFAKMPLSRPKLNARNLWLRDGGRRQYTGRELQMGEGNIDHVLPRSRGGATSWENCVLADRSVNTKKADKTPKEAGLELRNRPEKPRAVPVIALLQKRQDTLADWEPFLGV